MRAALHHDEHVARGDAQLRRGGVVALEEVGGGEVEAAAEDHRELLAVADESPGEGLVFVRDLDDGERGGAVAGVVEEVEGGWVRDGEDPGEGDEGGGETP